MRSTSAYLIATLVLSTSTVFVSCQFPFPDNLFGSFLNFASQTRSLVSSAGSNYFDNTILSENREENYVEDEENTHGAAADEAARYKAQVKSKTKADTVRFFLYTDLSSRFCPDELIYNDQPSIMTSRFNASNPVKIFIHGFGANYNCSFPQDIKDIYISTGTVSGDKLNVIVVDWKDLAAFSVYLHDVPGIIRSARILNDYYESVDNTFIAGKRVASMIRFLKRNGWTSLAKIHIVGFSLGAHVAGHAGREVMRSLKEKVGRITGLDPAMPLFQSGIFGTPLDKNDANFVDFVHTDMGQAGTPYSLGHANFFMNGGRAPQPSCSNDLVRSTSIADFIVKVIYGIIGVCSHNSALLYFAQSIMLDIPTKECPAYSGIIPMIPGQGLVVNPDFCTNSTELFGDRVSPQASGFFYVSLYPSPSSDIYDSCYPYPY